MGRNVVVEARVGYQVQFVRWPAGIRGTGHGSIQDPDIFRTVLWNERNCVDVHVRLCGLNCDVETVFADRLCIECDACVDICPMDCIRFTPDGEEAEVRARLNAPSDNASQDLNVGAGLKTGRIMAKDEDVCLHCGLCAERCPTGAWDMQKFLLQMTHAGPACRDEVPEPEVLA